MFAAQMIRRSFRRSTWALLALLPLGLLAAACGDGPDPRLSDVSEVLDKLDESFIDQEKLDPDAINRAAIEGIIDHLDDPYTAYFTQQQYQRFDDSLSGEESQFDGIGAEVTVRNDQILILGPLPGSPARTAGIRPGDIIVEVDGDPVDGKTLDEVVDQIRGTKGTEVVLMILRTGISRPFPVPVVRDTITVRTVTDRLQEPGIGYIRVDVFDTATVELLRAGIERLRADGAEGVVLDLRDNSGGLVDAAVGLVSEFVAEGLVFRWQNADGTEQPFEVLGEGSAYDLPLVVLVNRFSASAAEIVTGAIQDHDRGVVVGTRTFGKGSVTLLSQLESSAGLNVTTARWLTPDGRLIEGEGLAPDVQIGADVDFSSLQRLGQLTASLCNAYDEVGEAIADQESLDAALTTLCTAGEDPPPPPETDEILDAGVAQLRQLLGR